MDLQSPPLIIIGGSQLKWSDDLDILGVTFDSKKTFEKNICSDSIAASRRLAILRKYWRVFYNRLLLGRCFRCFVLPALGILFCSVVLGCRYSPETTGPCY